MNIPGLGLGLIGLACAGLGIWVMTWKGKAGSGLRSGWGRWMLWPWGPRLYPKVLGLEIVGVGALFLYASWLALR